MTHENLKNYKGIHHQNDEKPNYYEYGAHFSFKNICFKLNKILEKRNKQSEII